MYFQENTNTCYSDNEELGTTSNVITRMRCLDVLHNVAKDRKNLYIALAIFMGILFGIAGIFNRLFLKLVTIILPLCIIMFFYEKQRLKKINKLDFQIVVSECHMKDFKTDSGSGRIYNRKLYFLNNMSYKIDFSYKGIASRDAAEKTLYDSVKIHDSCYIVRVGKEKKASYVFPVKDFTVDDSEFINKGNVFVPVKDKNATTILADSLQSETMAMDSLLKEKVIKAEEETQYALKQLKRYALFSGIVLACTVIAIYSDLIHLLNFFVLPPLFIIPAKKAIKAVSSANRAVSNVSQSYSGYCDLRNKQNLGALSALLLMINLLLYLGNFIIFIVLKFEA